MMDGSNYCHVSPHTGLARFENSPEPVPSETEDPNSSNIVSSPFPMSLATQERGQ